MSSKRLLALLAAVGGATLIGISPAHALYDDEGLSLLEDSATMERLAAEKNGSQQPVGASSSSPAESSIGGSSSTVEVKTPSDGDQIDD